MTKGMDERPLDATDRRLLTLLRANARASVTELAGALGLGRSATQTRLARLARTHIERFTIEVRGDAPVPAITLIEVEGASEAAVARALRRLPQVASLRKTVGGWDLVARLETGSLSEIDRTLRAIREIKGVRNSETCLLLDDAGR